jgi:fatty acid amide hydrolase 2
VGGSSGGEGCILASAGSVVGIGSDIGGSIRMPAFFNGIYGHKPTRGVISNEVSHPPAFGLEKEMLATGPMCRYASDLSLMFKILAGPNAYYEYASKFESNVSVCASTTHCLYAKYCVTIILSG